MKLTLNRLPCACLLLLALFINCYGAGEAEVRFSVQGQAGVEDIPNVTVTFRDGDRIRRIELDASNRLSQAYSTKTAGDLEVRCSIASAQGENLNVGSIKLPLKNDWRWGVQFYISTNDPSDACFGCFGSESFALDSALGYEAEKKLYIVWGGNSISHPVVY
jgi:hypothetical protein